MTTEAQRFEVVQVWHDVGAVVVILFDNETRRYCVGWDGPLHAGQIETTDIREVTDAWFHGMELATQGGTYA